MPVTKFIGLGRAVLCALALTGAACQRPDSWNGESVPVQLPQGKAVVVISVDPTPYTQSRFALRVQVSLPATARPPLFSDIAVSAVAAHGRPVPCAKSDQAESPTGSGGSGGMTWSYFYDLPEVPISAGLTLNGRTYRFKRLRQQQLIYE